MLHKSLTSMSMVLQLLTGFLYSIGHTFKDFFTRGFKWLWHWVEVLVEGELPGVKLMYTEKSLADGMFKDFSDLYLSLVNAITVIAYG